MKKIKDMIVEDFLCLIIGIIMAVAFIAMVVGDGSKGLVDLL